MLDAHSYCPAPCETPFLTLVPPGYNQAMDKRRSTLKQWAAAALFLVGSSRFERIWKGIMNAIIIVLALFPVLALLPSNPPGDCGAFVFGLIVWAIFVS